jgi:hypothetical protein
MSGNTILDSMNKKESAAMEKMLQALKVLGGNNNTSQALLAEAERELKKINGRTEINIEKDSYMIEENEKGSIAVDELRAKNSKATDAEIEDAYREGCEKARRHNRRAKTVEPQWVMAEKDGENDTREEDTNIRYIDIQSHVVGSRGEDDIPVSTLLFLGLHDYVLQQTHNAVTCLNLRQKY